MLQELIEAEAAEVIGAGRYERTETRVTGRNGSRPRLLTTKAGGVALRIPKLRAGSFFPSILEPRRRIDQALYAVVMEAYVHGVSTRAIDDLVWPWAAPGSPSPRSAACVRGSTRRHGPRVMVTMTGNDALAGIATDARERVTLALAVLTA